jgi:hypothetical protein
VVKTTGRRKAYKVFGLIEFFSGRHFYRGIDGKFNGQSYSPSYIPTEFLWRATKRQATHNRYFRGVRGADPLG